jgi:protein-disulfide isomerase
MQNFLALGAVLALILGAAACQPAGSAADLQEIKRVQAEILEKLVALEKKLPATQARAQRPDDEFDRVYEIEVGEAPIRGNPNAEVTIVEYSDFQCPFCARAQPILEAVLEKYPDDVRLVYKHFPLSFHKAARPTAIASLAAMEQGLFWEMHDVLFEAGSDLDAAKIQHYAEKAGLDIERFNRDMETKKAAYDSLITTDYRAGSEVDVRGTPTLFVNGKKVRVRTVEGMSAMIDAALAAKAG